MEYRHTIIMGACSAAMSGLNSQPSRSLRRYSVFKSRRRGAVLFPLISIWRAFADTGVKNRETFVLAVEPRARFRIITPT